MGPSKVRNNIHRRTRQTVPLTRHHTCRASLARSKSLASRGRRPEPAALAARVPAGHGDEPLSLASVRESEVLSEAVALRRCAAAVEQAREDLGDLRTVVRPFAPRRAPADALRPRRRPTAWPPGWCTRQRERA